MHVYLVGLAFREIVLDDAGVGCGSGSGCGEKGSCKAEKGRSSALLGVFGIQSCSWWLLLLSLDRRQLWRWWDHGCRHWSRLRIELGWSSPWYGIAACQYTGVHGSHYKYNWWGSVCVCVCVFIIVVFKFRDYWLLKEGDVEWCESECNQDCGRSVDKVRYPHSNWHILLSSTKLGWGYLCGECQHKIGPSPFSHLKY